MGWVRGVGVGGALSAGVFASGVWAAEPAATAAAAASSSSSSGSYTGVSMLMLILLACGVAALAWLMRRGVGTGAGGAPGIRVLAAQGLGQRERVLVVSVGSRYFLLGHTAHNVTMLAELSAEDVPQPASRLPDNLFADLLAKLKK